MRAVLAPAHPPGLPSLSPHPLMALTQKASALFLRKSNHILEDSKYLGLLLLKLSPPHWAVSSTRTGKNSSFYPAPC